jgi:hypothetical protein
MIAITKKLADFCISHKHRLTVVLVAGLTTMAATQIQPGQTFAAAPPPEQTPPANLEKLTASRLMPMTAPVKAVAAPQPAPATVAPVQPQAAPAAPAVPELVGAVGYARAGGNCVNEPGVNNPRTGNPSSWAATSRTPWIGATVLFTWNHTGVVTGIWSNGDVEVRHQNYWGGQHRFPQSMIRGYR